MNTHAVHLLAAPYVIDALDEADRAAFESHLEACHECAAEIRWMREAVARLALSVAVDPADHVWGRVARDIAVVRPLPPLAPAPASPAISTINRRRRPRRPRRMALAAAAALIAVIGVGAAVSLGSDDATPSLSASAQVLQAPDRAHSTVESDRGWEATVWHSDSVGRAVIVTRHLPAPPDGLVYQLWLDQPASGRVSAGVMSPGADQTVLLLGDATTANGAAITLEPAGGSTRPSAEPIASFDFGQGA